MTVVTTLDAYDDAAGNRIVPTAASAVGDVRIKFTGRNNRVVIDDGARLGSLRVDFDCDDGLLEIGSSSGVPAFAASIRIGQDSRVVVGRDVSCTSSVAMSATEGTTISIGDDVMFASENQLRADDGHPIFDVRTGRRVNTSRSITVGSHVWLGRFSTLLGGASVGDGSVVGYGAVLTRAVPNNCVVAGVPARVVRRHVAWERPHLSLVRPFYKPDASTVAKSAYWNLTSDDDDAQPTGEVRRPSVIAALRQRFRQLVGRG
jgi:acetyltransferase-like isoleucine patch superfamily enzyme